MQISPTQLKLIKEQAIREYKLKHKEYLTKRSFQHKLKKLVGRLIPINLAIGIVASGIYIYLTSWTDYFFILLRAIIWITIVSAILSVIIHKHS